MSASRPVFHMIWTRPIDNQPMAGRLRIALSVREALREVGTVSEHILAPAIGASLARTLLVAGWAFLKSVFERHPLPLQCLLYAAPAEIRRAVASVPADTDAIYLDGVRTFVLLRALRRAFPDKRIVVDLDDLMSRRMRLLLRAGQPLSPGYLTTRLPRPLVAWLSGVVGRLLVRYEAETLPHVEAAMTHLAQAVVLLSSEDMRALEGDGPAEHAVIPPAVPMTPEPAGDLTEPLRFIFIGSDSLTQNRLTIDYLLELWQRDAITSELVIIGRQTRTLALPAHVSMAGYVEHLIDVYDGHSILIAPSFLGGGIKTKVLEAFARHTPVIGNPATFESLNIGDYPLVYEDGKTSMDLLRTPGAYRSVLAAAASSGAAYIRAHHDPASFAERWQAVMIGKGAPALRPSEATGALTR